MKLIVGLGNPGSKYSKTRHNIGFRIVESLAEQHALRLDQKKFDALFARGRICGEDVGLLLPQTYMNCSGKSVSQALRLLPVEDLSKDFIVIFDDVDLPFGQLRIKASGGAGGQKGVADIIAKTGSKDFPRLRFGIGRDERMQTSDYVLQKFSREQEKELEHAVRNATDAVEYFVQGDLDECMNRFNVKN